jgi:hypothetical protein
MDLGRQRGCQGNSRLPLLRPQQQLMMVTNGSIGRKQDDDQDIKMVEFCSKSENCEQIMKFETVLFAAKSKPASLQLPTPASDYTGT